MAVFQAVVLKGTDFHGVEEEFSNVYQLNTGTGEAFDDEAALRSLVDLERQVMDDSVRFISGVTYEGDPGNLTPRYRAFYDEPGVDRGGLLYYRECAVLVSQELPRSGFFGLGRRRWLRKWLHTCSLPGGTIAGAEATVQGVSPIPDGVKDFVLDNYWIPLATEEHGGGRLSGPNGDYPLENSEPFVADYLEHRQFHR